MQYIDEPEIYIPNAHTYPLIAFEHVVTALEAEEGFEWRFPFPQYPGVQTCVTNLTIFHPDTWSKAGLLFVEDTPSGNRVFVSDVDKLAGWASVKDYIVPTGARSILQINYPTEGVCIKVSYLVRRSPSP